MYTDLAPDERHGTAETLPFLLAGLPLEKGIPGTSSPRESFALRGAKAL